MMNKEKILVMYRALKFKEAELAWRAFEDLPSVKCPQKGCG
jgi:hypothetical protein